MKKSFLLIVFVSCSGVPSIGTVDSGVGGSAGSSSIGGNTNTGGATLVCNKPSWAGTVGTLPLSLPNQIPPGYITSVVANGTSVLTVSYSVDNGVSISVGNDSGISITGTWSKDGIISSINSSGSSFKINNSVFTVVGATVSGSAAWSGINAGVGQITGTSDTLNFLGYNANSGTQTGALRFVGTCL